MEKTWGFVLYSQPLTVMIEEIMLAKNLPNHHVVVTNRSMEDGPYLLTFCRWRREMVKLLAAAMDVSEGLSR